MPFRHPAPRRSTTHVDEFRNRMLQAKFIVTFALLGVALIALAEALGIEQKNYVSFLLAIAIAVVILDPIYNFIRSWRYSRRLEQKWLEEEVNKAIMRVESDKSDE